MITLLPLLGDTERFRPLLDRWFASYDRSGLDRKQAVILTHLDLEHVSRERHCGLCRVEIEGFADLIRPGEPFDVKGALVCAYLLRWDYPTLVLDADAFLARDPAAELRNFADCPIAMCVDGGAVMHGRAANLDAPFADVRKLCAGVQWFGHHPCGRSRLVAGYRRAWEELRALPKLPWSPPLSHLLEQHAWSVCARRRGGRVLPPAFNWAPHFLGENDAAIVNHWYGFKKWAEFKPALA